MRRDDYNPNTWGNIIAAAFLAMLGLMAWERAHGAVTTATHTSYALRPCSTCREVAYPTQVACNAAAEAEAQRVGQTRTTGSAVYTCVARTNVIATFRPGTGTPTPTCLDAPAPRTQQCPAGTTGTWQQTATVSAAPSCAITWSPSTAPAGACTTIAVDPTGTATLTWTHDGLNATGFRIVYGASPSALTQVVQLNSATQRTFRVELLAPGTMFFAVKAFGTAGESAASNVVSKVVP